MSWVSDLANKAETILNKIDKNAATALVTPPGGSAGLPTIRKGLSSSTQSLKASMSPTKTKRSGHTFPDSGSSAKSEGFVARAMSDSLDSKEKLEWHLTPDAVSSRRTSVSSKADESVAIDMMGTVAPEASPIEPRPTLNIASGSQMSGSTSESQELAAFKIALNEVTSERDELKLRLNASNRDIENAALKQCVQEMELLVLRLTEERDHAQQEVHGAQTATNAYVHSISELETNLAKLQQEYLEVAQKLQMQMKETEQQRQELKEYRTKAQRALQMKDNLIAELKASGSGSASGQLNTNDTDSDRVRQMEYDGLKQDHQNSLDENRKLLLQLEEVRHDLAALDKQQVDQLATLRSNENALRKELRMAREKALSSESEQRVLAQELQTLRQQLSNHMAASATHLQEKELQLEQLRKGATDRRAPQSDAESRIKALTQALVDKQNTVENVTADRNALRLQLEKVQDRLQQTMYSSSHVPPRNAILSNTTDDLKAQFPMLMRENPFDNRVSRRVKRAYSSLDSAGIRLGAFLRRYPLMRIFVLMYVALLHMWVMFVLLAYSPN